MSLNTYPYNSFPASTDKLDEAHNAELQQEIDQLKSGLTNVIALAHEDYIDVYQYGMTVHVYLRSVGTATPNDTYTLATNMPLPKGLQPMYSKIDYYDGTSSQTGKLTINVNGNIDVLTNAGTGLYSAQYMSGELIYLIN